MGFETDAEVAGAVAQVARVLADMGHEVVRGSPPVRRPRGHARDDGPLVLRLRPAPRGILGAQRPRDRPRHARARHVLRSTNTRSACARSSSWTRWRPQHGAPQARRLLHALRRLALADDREGRRALGPLQPRPDRRDASRRCRRRSFAACASSRCRTTSWARRRSRCRWRCTRRAADRRAARHAARRRARDPAARDGAGGGDAVGRRVPPLHVSR